MRGGNDGAWGGEDDVSRFATSSLLSRVEARARCAAASPPARRSQELSGGGFKPPLFSLPPCGGGLGWGVASLSERVPVVDPTPASPRLIAGLSSSASAGPIGCTSGRCAFDFGVLFGFLPGFLRESGVFAISAIWDEFAPEKRVAPPAGTACHKARLRCQQLSGGGRIGKSSLRGAQATKQSRPFV